MEPKETTQQKVARVARELGSALRERAGGEWGKVRVGKRDLGNRHVWRFRTGSDNPDRYLVVSHRAMADGENPTAKLLKQLEKAQWLDRLQVGPATSFRLRQDGRLHARPAQ